MLDQNQPNIADFLHPIGVIPSTSFPGTLPYKLSPSGYTSFDYPAAALQDPPEEAMSPQIIQSTEDIKLLNQHYI